MAYNVGIVKVDNEDCRGKDEYWGLWYKCKHCKMTDILEGHKYCPNCGYKIEWKLENNDDC